MAKLALNSISKPSNSSFNVLSTLICNVLFFQVHKIIGFAPVLLQVVMSVELEMPVKQAGEYVLQNNDTLNNGWGLGSEQGLNQDLETGCILFMH